MWFNTPASRPTGKNKTVPNTTKKLTYCDITTGKATAVNCRNKITGQTPIKPLASLAKTESWIVWNIGLLSTADLYAWLDLALRNQRKERILRVKRIQNGTTVFAELELIAGPRAISTLGLLFASCKEKQFKMVPGRLYVDRVALRAGNSRVVQERKKNTEVKKSLRCISWNVCGMGGARQGVVAALVRDQAPDVLCLQETLREYGMPPLRLDGYSVLESYCIKGNKGEFPGCRGIALAIREDLVGFHVGGFSNFFKFVRVLVPASRRAILVACVYLPPRVPGVSVKVRGEFIRGLASLRTRFPEDNVVVAGDFNLSIKKINSRILPVSGLKRCGGEETTFVRNGCSPSVIDHILADDAMFRVCSKHGVVQEESRLSDHLPVGATFLIESVGNTDAWTKAASTPGWNKDRVRTQAAPIKYHNRFADLASETENLDLDTLTSRFEEAIHEVAIELNLMKGPVCVKKGARVPLWPKAVKRLFQKRDQLDKKIKNLVRPSVNPDKNTEINQELWALKICRQELVCEIKKAIKFTYRRQQVARIRKGCSLLANNKPKLFFRWAAAQKEGAIIGHTKVSPIVNDDGILVLQPEEILAAWRSHFARLNSGSDESSWCGPLNLESGVDITSEEEEVVVSEEEELKSFPVLPNCDGEIMMNELQLALEQLGNGKAAGPDGIPSEIFKAAKFEKHHNIAAGFQTEEGQNPLADILLSLVNRMFEQSDIPSSWKTSDLVPVPKKGDPTNRDDYRGIALIPIGVKLVCKILNNRLARAIELRTPAQGGFIEEQAGFRGGEEAVGQVATLYEVYRRRLLKKEDTYLTFIDFKKAYDVVPHDLLFVKMTAMGVPAKILAFIQGMYRESYMQVKLPNSQRSAPWVVARGLRQGCPLSPLLFSIYINDIFDGEARNAGVPVKGLERLCGTKLTRLAGLLFADDLALTAESLEKMQVLLNCVTKWADRWEMKVGHSKCGLMIICSEEERRATLLAEAELVEPKLQGSEVKLVSSYEYLGFTIHQSGEKEAAISNRTAKLARRLNDIRHVLESYDYPLLVKRVLINSVVLPTGLYGAEVTGMSRSGSRTMDSTLNRALRGIIHSKTTGGFSNTALHLELGVDSIYAISSSRRLRAFLKYPNQKSWIKNLFFGDTFRHVRQTWITKTRRWANRYAKTLLETDPKKAAKKIKQSLMSVELLKEVKNNNLSALRYLKSEFQKTRHYQKLSLKFPEASKGFHLLLKMRVGAFWPLSDESKKACPFCKSNQVADTTHLLLECESFEEDQLQFVTPITEEVLGRAEASWKKSAPFVEIEDITTAILGGKGADAEWYAGDSGRTWNSNRREKINARRKPREAVSSLMDKAFEEFKGLDAESRECLMKEKYDDLEWDFSPNEWKLLKRTVEAAGLGLSKAFATNTAISSGAEQAPVWPELGGVDLPAVQLAIFLTKVARRIESMVTLKEPTPAKGMAAVSSEAGPDY